MKRFRPDYYSQNIFDVDVSFFVKRGYKCVLCDLDNTLDAFNELNPSLRVRQFKEKLDKANIKLCIVSNNRASRKSIYCERLGVEGIFSCRKPFAKKINEFITKLNFKKSEVILVGDQLLTDVRCAKNVGIKVILTEPITKKDQWTTKFNRLIDKPIRSYLRKHGYLEGVKITNE